MEDLGREIRVRIRATGQVIDMAPIAARALLNGGTAELVEETETPNGETKSAPAETKPAKVETAAVEGSAETSVAPAQHKNKKHRSAR